MLFFFVFGIVVNWLVSCPGHVVWWDLTARITAEEFVSNLLVRGEDGTTMEGTEMLHN